MASSQPSRPQLAFLPSLPPAHLLALWDAAVAELRSLALVTDFYVRPPPVADTVRSAVFGTAFIRPPHLRLVPETADKAVHLHAALALTFPSMPAHRPPTADLRAAIRASLVLGSSVDSWRATRVKSLSRIAASLDSLSAWLRLLQPRHASLLPPVHLAMSGAMADAIGWPHTTLLQSLVEGFAVVGDIPDTGLFRPVNRPATHPLSTFSPASNLAFNAKLISEIRAAAQRLSPDDRRTAEAVAKATAKERCSDLIRGPFTSRDLDKVFGRGVWRAMRRFGVEQGHGDSWKVRPIDNFKSNLGNAVTSSHETIHTVGFDWPAHALSAVAALARELNLPIPSAGLGLDDQKSAYRFILSLHPNFMVFAIFNFETGKVDLYWLPGHIFGALAAVLNHNAWSAFHVAIARVFLACITEHYFDDFPTITLQFAPSLISIPLNRKAQRGSLSSFLDKANPQQGVAASHKLTNTRLASEKHEPAAYSNKFMGVMCDTSSFHTSSTISFHPDPGRVDRLLAFIARCRATDSLSPSAAGTLRGKLGFVLTHAYGRIGRAATQPLVERDNYGSATDHALNASILACFDFFEALLPRLPRLTIHAFPPKRKPLIIYSDAASFDLRPGVVHSELAFTIIDPESPSTPIYSISIMPQEFYPLLSSFTQKYINIAEAVALAAALFTCPDMFRGRSFIHFCDNTYALSLFVHGYAHKHECATIVNQYYLLLASLNAHPYFEWVPSEANLADLPSRESRSPKHMALFLDLLPAARRPEARVPFTYPPFFHGRNDLVAYAEAVAII